MIAGEGVDMIADIPPAAEVVERMVKEASALLAGSNRYRVGEGTWPRFSKVPTGPGLVFDVLADGPDGAPLVLLLHGFAESFHTWDAQIAALAAPAIARSRRASAATRPARGRTRPTRATTCSTGWSRTR